MKKLLSVVLCLVMMVSAVGIPVIAEAASVGKVSTLKVTYTSNSAVKLKWNKVKGATGYQVFKSTNKSKGFKKVKTVNKGKAVTAAVKSLKKNKTYYFKVRAVKKSAKGKFSKVVKASTVGTIKSCEVLAYDVSEDEGGFVGIQLFPENVSGISGYQIKYWGGTYDVTEPWIEGICFGCQDYPGAVKIRAYKKTKSGRLYGAWKTVYNLSIGKKIKTYKNVKASYWYGINAQAIDLDEI
ncbi:MAG: fibronectin type III domain-containing protein [Eubacterium sp.]|nr:fibronectin type III domain-containing protein [Eubacterium sp.]